MDFCSAGQALSQSFFMKCLVFGKLFICIVGMILLVWILHRYGIKWLGHINAKLIFFVHIFFTFLVVFNFSLVHALDLIRLFKVHENPCDYLVPVTLSFSLRVPCQIFIYIQVLTMLSLAIERLLAVRNPRDYEQIKRPTLALLLIGLPVVFSVSFVLSMLLPGVDFTRSYPGFVSRTKENGTRYYAVILFQLLPETLTLIIFNVIREKSKKTANLDLNTRYQLEENSKICHHLLPVFYSHALILMCSAAGISLIPLAQSFLSLGDVSFAMALEMTGWAILYAALMPIIVHLRTIYRKRSLAKRTHLGSLNYFIPVGAYPSPEHSAVVVLWRSNKNNSTEKYEANYLQNYTVRCKIIDMSRGKRLTSEKKAQAETLRVADLSHRKIAAQLHRSLNAINQLFKKAEGSKNSIVEEKRSYPNQTSA